MLLVMMVVCVVGDVGAVIVGYVLVAAVGVVAVADLFLLHFALTRIRLPAALHGAGAGLRSGGAVTERVQQRMLQSLHLAVN